MLSHATKTIDLLAIKVALEENATKMLKVTAKATTRVTGEAEEAEEEMEDGEYDLDEKSRSEQSLPTT